MHKARCAQCGREGERNFKVIGGRWEKLDPHDNEPAWIPFTTVCASSSACERRQVRLWNLRFEDRQAVGL